MTSSLAYVIFSRSPVCRSVWGYKKITKINKITHVSVPYGPHKITRVRQVAIPHELLRAIGLEPGDNVHFRLNDDDPYVIEIIPSDIVARRYQAGTGTEALERLSEPATPDDLLRNADREAAPPKDEPR